MADSMTSEERRQIEQWLEESRKRRQLILEQVALINGMLRSQSQQSQIQKKFSIALEKNAAEFAKLAPK